MQKYISIIVSILILSNVIVAATLWGQLSYQAIQEYRSPLRGVQLWPQAKTIPKTSKVVLVLISGLGNETATALELPFFERLKQAGATMAVESTPPTYSQTSWATIISGAFPEMNDAPPIDKPTPELYPLEIDTLFARAHEAQLHTALLGSTVWASLIPPQHLDYTLFADDPTADEIAVETAISMIENKSYDFLLLHLNQLAQTTGAPTDPAYQQAAKQIDTYLEKINQTMDLGHSVLIVTSDHGYLADGGYGGAEEELIWQPLIMIGEKVIPGEYSDIRQIDLAPTLAVLLGVTVPTTAQGRVLFETLRLTDHERATTQLLIARQRVALAEAYTSVISGQYIPMPPSFAMEVGRAEASLQNKNLNGAFEQAHLIEKQADEYMLITKTELLGRARLWRALVAVMVFIAWAMATWKLRGGHASALIFSTIAVVALYHALYQLQGYSYSISSFKNFTELPLEVSRRTAVSMLTGGALLMIILLFSDEGNWSTLLEVGYQFGMMVTFTFALPLFWTFWQNGLLPRWYLPDVLSAFWQMTALVEVAVAAILGLLIPWPIMSLSVFVTLVRHRLSETESKTAVSGLHFQ